MWVIILLLQSMVNSNLLVGSQIPVLCYHNLEATGPGNNLYIDAASFRRQLQSLHDSGYRTPDPIQLINGADFPPKPIIITFDDSHAAHFKTAAPILETTGFKGIFFVMTVTIGKKGYLSAEEIKSMHKRGHWIGSHTWDHPHITGNQGIPDAINQLSKSKSTLERITGIPVIYFAYPYGIWNETIVTQVKEAGYKAAFQLTGKKMSVSPGFTVRRLLVNGSWSGPHLIHVMKETFN